MPSVQKTVLSNGISVITEDMPGVASCSLGIWVNAGSRNETRAINGVSHFIEHLLRFAVGTADRYGVMRIRRLVAIAAAVLVLVAPARAAGGFRAIVYPDRTQPGLTVFVDDFRVNETVWDYGGVQHVWVRGPAGHFQLPFSRIRPIEFVRYIGRDYSRTDWTWYDVKVTGTEPGEWYTGRLEIRVLRGVAAGVPWYLFPSTEANGGRALYRIVFGDSDFPPTLPWVQSLSHSLRSPVTTANHLPNIR